MADPQVPTVRLAPPAAQAARHAAIAGASPIARQFVPLAGGYREVPVIALPADLLLYRAGNGRVLAELGERVRQDGGSVAAIRAEEASAPVQQLLHGLLVAKAADPTGPVLQELARHGQQTEPLLATAEGVLVNGNRRLAAMRELRARDPARYAGFATVTAAILPAETSAQEMEELDDVPE